VTYRRSLMCARQVTYRRLMDFTAGTRKPSGERLYSPSPASSRLVHYLTVDGIPTLIDEISSAWDVRWAETPPIAFLLRDLHADRWVRFHSLPESKRYAETDEERAEILSRHHAVLNALESPPRLLATWPVFRSEPKPADGKGLWWRTIDYPNDFFAEPGQLYVRSVGYPSVEFDTLLSAAAEWEVANVIVGPPDLRWLYHPYDGGADVIAPTMEDRDRLRTEFSGWLSSYPGGL
jgi:hypothetical protein